MAGVTSKGVATESGTENIPSW